MKLYGICYIFNLTEAVVQLRDQLLVSHYGRIDDTISGNVIGNVVADEGQGNQRYHSCDQKCEQELIAK